LEALRDVLLEPLREAFLDELFEVDFDADLEADLAAPFEAPLEDLEEVLEAAFDDLLPAEDLRAEEDFEADFPAADLLADLLFVLPEDDSLLEGTFSPAFLASDKPIAIACLRDVTVFPVPLLSWPRFSSCSALFTLLPAPFEYLAIYL
jgi:hypothetical protein